MAPKGKSKKSVKKVKASTVVDALSTEDMNKDQLEEHIVRLREELDREREEKSYFQLERDRVQSLWETGIRDLDRVQTELNQRRREREEAEERHRMEIHVYKQKLKHVLAEQHSAVSELKTNKTSAQILDQTQHQDRELDLVQGRSDLQTRLREKQRASGGGIRDLQLKQQVELMELMNNYDQKIKGVEDKYRALGHSLGQEYEKRLEREVAEVEQSAQRQVSELRTQHERAMRAAEEYYSNMYHKLESDHKQLTAELSEVRLQLTRVNKKLSEAKSENERLKQDLTTAQREVPVLQRKLQEYYECRAQEEKSRVHVKSLEQEIRGVRMELTLLRQAFTKLEQERDQLKGSHLQLVLDVQRRAGLKEALLNRKLSALSLELDRKEELVRGCTAEVK